MLVHVLKEMPESTKEELAQKLGRSRATITRQLQKLKEMNIVRRIGSDKTGRWEVV